MTDIPLFRKRVALVQAFLRRHGHDGVLLSRIDNFAMATGGRRNYVNQATDAGACGIFINKSGHAFFVGNNIEAQRIADEEFGGLESGIHDFLWFEGNAAERLKKDFSGDLVSDDGSIGKNVHGQLAVLRATLLAEELEKYRRLGKLGAAAMEECLGGILPGSTEADIAAVLVAAGAKRHCSVPVVLVAVDQRIAKYRHPLPTQSRLLDDNVTASAAVQRYVMVVGCFLREGLVVSITRFKRVDDLPGETLDAYNRICAVDALVQEATQPGATLGEVFDACRAAYASQGFADNEWHNHHQGGATGYAGRTVKGRPGEPFRVLEDGLARDTGDILGCEIPVGQAYAWNPSAPGVKSEDTFLVLPDGTQEIVTATPALGTVDLHAVLGRPTAVNKSAVASP